MTEDDLISQANKAAARMEAANAQMTDIVKRQEVLQAQQEAVRIMGGRSAAGAQAPQVSDAERLKQETKDFFKGTSIAGAFK